MAIDIYMLKKTINEIKEDLGEGFVATDIWATADAKLDSVLISAEYPGLGSYYLINLANNHPDGGGPRPGYSPNRRKGGKLRNTVRLAAPGD